LLLTFAGSAVGSIDEVAAVTDVASPIRNMIFFAIGESPPRVWLNACHQPRSPFIHFAAIAAFLSEFLAEFRQTVQRLLDGLQEKSPCMLVNEIFRN